MFSFHLYSSTPLPFSTSLIFFRVCTNSSRYDAYSKYVCFECFFSHYESLYLGLHCHWGKSTTVKTAEREKELKKRSTHYRRCCIWLVSKNFFHKDEALNRIQFAKFLSVCLLVRQCEPDKGIYHTFSRFVPSYIWNFLLCLHFHVVCRFSMRWFFA